MLSKAWDLSRDEKRSNVGCRHQIRQQTTTKHYSNARKAQDFGSYKVMRSQIGRDSETPSCGFMAFPDVARRFSSLLFLKILRGPFLVNFSSTSTSTLTISASRHLIAWSDPLLVSFPTSARILGNN